MTDTPNPALLLLHYSTRFHLALMVIGAAGAAVAYAVTSSFDVALKVGGVVATTAGFIGLLLLMWTLYDDLDLERVIDDPEIEELLEEERDDTDDREPERVMER